MPQPRGYGIRKLSRYAIRLIQKSEASELELAQEYGVSHTTIQRIRGPRRKKRKIK